MRIALFYFCRFHQRNPDISSSKVNLPHVIFRVDGDSEIGMGHIVRCVRVARAIAKEIPVEIIFATRTPETLDAYLKEKKGFEIKSFKDESIDSILGFYADYAPQVVVTDANQGADIDKYVRAVEKVPLHVNIHEMHFEYFPFGIVVFPSILPVKKKCACESKAEYLVGEKYLLIDPRLRTLKPTVIDGKNPIQILVSVGGADPGMQTLKVISAAKELKIDATLAQLKIVVGPAYVKRDSIIKAAEGLSNFTIINARSSLFDLISESNFVITNAGTTAYEVLAAGRPSWLLPQNEFENEVAKLLNSKRAIIGFGINGLREDFFFQLDSFRMNPGRINQISETAQKEIDGKGVERVAEKIVSALKAISI